MHGDQSNCSVPVIGDLLLESFNMIVLLKNLLLERLVNEALESTATEDDAIKRASDLSQRIKKEIIGGPTSQGNPGEDQSGNSGVA
jgi:hypothetical protein